MYEIDLRFNRPLDAKTERLLDDQVIALLRWNGDAEHVVLTFGVDHDTELSAELFELLSSEQAQDQVHLPSR